MQIRIVNLMRKVKVVSRRIIREKLQNYLSIQAQIQESRYFEILQSSVKLAEYLHVDRSGVFPFAKNTLSANVGS